MFKHLAGLISILFVLVVLITQSPAVTAQEVRWRVESPVSLTDALADSLIKDMPHLAHIAPPYTAAWGPDGNVIAGGYAFKLVQE
jgi:hypothetical protein